MGASLELSVSRIRPPLQEGGDADWLEIW